MKCPKCKNKSITQVAKYWACGTCRFFSSGKRVFNPNSKLFKEAEMYSEECWLMYYITSATSGHWGVETGDHDLAVYNGYKLTNFGIVRLY